MSNTPKHCEIAIEYFTLAKELGSYEEANKHFEHHADLACWSVLTGVGAPSFSPFFHYRRKPETHTVNGHEVPAPYRKKPECHESFYFSSVNSFVSDIWCNTVRDLECFNSNNCFKSESDAEENRLAMFKIGKYAEVNV